MAMMLITNILHAPAHHPPPPTHTLYSENEYHPKYTHSFSFPTLARRTKMETLFTKHLQQNKNETNKKRKSSHYYL